MSASPSTSAVKAMFTEAAPPFSICVYCGAQDGADPVFLETAKAVGTWIARHGGQLVYGGGHAGLMGAAANAALQAGGRVIGVIPKALVERELANHACTELHIVETMHQRKHLMAEHSTAFLALPGGVGTFEELFEVWAWRYLGYHDKPIALLNTCGYYDHLLQFLQHSHQQGFTRASQMQMLHVGNDVDSTLQALVATQPARTAI